MLGGTTYKNTLLKKLGAESIERLRLHPVRFELHGEIEYPGKLTEHLFFVEEGMAVMSTTFDDGSQVEVGMFGYESLIGVAALIGTARSYKRVCTQIAGFGYSTPLEAARQEFNRGGAFQKLALRYVHAQLVQAAQSSGCNARHNTEQRLARWLLHCIDRVHSDRFTMSQDSLADMLGSTRPTVSLAAGILKDKKLIEYSRGVIRILDVKGLEKRACECYGIVKDYLDDYTESRCDATAEPGLLGISKRLGPVRVCLQAAMQEPHSSQKEGLNGPPAARV